MIGVKGAMRIDVSEPRGGVQMEGTAKSGLKGDRQGTSTGIDVAGAVWLAGVIGRSRIGMRLDQAGMMARGEIRAQGAS
jgi:hypothetical protein